MGGRSLNIYIVSSHSTPLHPRDEMKVDKIHLLQH
jgi:hypothetical protein